MEKPKTIHTKVLILGSGPAGLTAAIYAARANLKPVLISGMVPGGQLTTTTDVENYPGFADPINGPWLMQQMMEQAKRLDVLIINDQINKVELKDRPFKCLGEENLYVGDTLIIATGANPRWLGLPSEEHYKGKGVSSCATCDGFFYKNKNVCVIGGGNVAAEDSLYLANFAKQVTLIHRRDSMRAEKILQNKLLAHPKIKTIWNSVVVEVLGGGQPECVTGLRIQNVKTSEETTLSIDGIFVAIGHTPNTALFTDFLKMDEEKYIIVSPNSTETNIKGVFAAGDVQDKIYRQAVIAAAHGCMAAIEVGKYLSTNSEPGI
jgi:thioredoxin reductase (NADPH)